MNKKILRWLKKIIQIPWATGWHETFLPWDIEGFTWQSWPGPTSSSGGRWRDSWVGTLGRWIWSEPSHGNYPIGIRTTAETPPLRWKSGLLARNSLRCVCAPSTRNSVGFQGMSLVDVTAPCLTSPIGTRAQQLAQKELGGWYPDKYFVTHWPVYRDLCKICPEYHSTMP